ncbi:MAG: cation-translocating P-type ATPase [Firmicutes bacterium]|nr:cation-translocating P-type ATPase [Bacillota bacterium]
MGQIIVSHNLPGRVRFKVPSIKNNQELCKIMEENLNGLPGIRLITASRFTGTVLIYYSADRTSIKSLISIIGEHLNKSSGDRSDAAAALSPGMVPVPFCGQAGLQTKFREPEELPIPLQIANVTMSGIVMLALAAKRFLGKTAISPGGKLLNLSSATTFLASYPIIRSGISGFIREKRLNNDMLISAATLVALVMGEGLTALAVVWLVNLSELLKTLTLDRSRRAIGNLLKDKNEQAWLLVDGTQVSVPVDSLKPGDIVVVRAGGKIPVDGRVSSGTAAVNQSPITGESVPVYKQQGNSVYAGTVVEQGSIHVCAEKVGDNTALSRIIYMVEEAGNKKAPIQNLAESYSYKIVPLSFLLASMVFLITRDIYRTMTILIVACPCAAGLATPTAISAAMGNAASRGILIKGGCYLEAAGRLDTVLFDKTGTLTEGRPIVSTYVSLDDRYTPEQILILAAAGEMYTNHPLALAVINKARESKEAIPDCQDKELIVGKGLKVTVNNEVILIGNNRLMREENIDQGNAMRFAGEMKARGESIIYVARQSKLIGLIGVRDELRKQSKHAISELKTTGIKEIGLISGDNAACARAVGNGLELNDVWSNMLPEDKVKVVQDKQRQGKIVAMVGEGINDSPALAAADIGIAMGIKGTDVAVESADVVLSGDDPVKVAQLVKLSRRTMQVIHQNFAFAIGANALGITLGTLRIISPFAAALLHNASTLAVVVNSARLIKYENN